MKKREIKVSPEFKKQARNAIMSINLFILTYVLMLALATGLTFLCVYGGIKIITFKPTLVTIALGVGLASLGILVLIFLLKFMIKSHKFDRSHLYEICKEDEPELFAIIDDIALKVNTSFPKKIYLSTDVNASVFYDSNFWSMFFPIRKNLQIGLALVNSVSKSELTAILSHEFGHFSQKSMKVGSYVYNVNQIIYNLLYDNEAYDALIQKWANVSDYFTTFVELTVKIIEGIQWVLRKVYETVNKNYMGLSREMEFHADEIAASITGFEPLKSSLLRMSLADFSFNDVLSFYEGRIANNQKSQNLYAEHLYVMNFLAKESCIKIDNNFPQVTDEELNKFNKSKLVIKDQWASHPSVEDRIQKLEETNLSSENIEHLPANTVFSNIKMTQEELTRRMFDEIQYQEEANTLTVEEFQIEHKNAALAVSFSKIYNNYYDNKNPAIFELETPKTTDETLKFEDLFSDQKIDLVYSTLALQNDLETLNQIADKTFPIKTFDYDGKKFNQPDSKALISKLEVDLQQVKTQIENNDIAIFNFFYRTENKEKSTPLIESLYKDFFNYDNVFDANFETYSKLSDELQFVNVTTPFDEIRENFAKIEPIEIKLKKGIKELLADTMYQSEITTEIRANFELYISREWQYFQNETYLDKNLEVIFAAINNYAFLLSRGYFLLKKHLLDYQADLIKETHGRV